MRTTSNIKEIKGPLIVVQGITGAAYKEIVHITLADNTVKKGQVLAVGEQFAVCQVFESTMGLSLEKMKVAFTGKTATVKVSDSVLGRIFDGSGNPIDGHDFFGTKKMDIMGKPLNPVSRVPPKDFIQTGVSTIDCMIPLVRGQKLPIFSMAGMPQNELAAQIARQATVLDGKEFAVVFCAMGVTQSEQEFFIKEFTQTGALEHTALFINKASDSTVERIMAPRIALTHAEHLAYDCGKHVLVIMTDMTNYCDALRQISAAREEIPGRRGYPGYMYTDLAQLYERAGIAKGSAGSITQIPILSMPGDDKTHPVPDLTGYITEGQIVLDRRLLQKHCLPPIAVLGSLSRLKVDKKQVREDTGAVAAQLYAAYATGIELRNLAAVVGAEALSARDQSYLVFADEFESKFVNQGFDEERTLEQTLDIAWELFAIIPKNELKKLKKDMITKYYDSKK
ncbi:MAG: V/A-type H+-transporting ATPase subunit B [Candidatus Woesearchaeota archaeon]|jgi:V/A-type H+-transporting ATPase subunit B